MRPFSHRAVMEEFTSLVCQSSPFMADSTFCFDTLLPEGEIDCYYQDNSNSFSDVSWSDASMVGDDTELVYTNLENANFYTSGGFEDIKPMNPNPIEHWLGEEVVSWASDALRRHGVCDGDLEPLRNTTGLYLTQCSLEDLSGLVGHLNANILYQELHNNNHSTVCLEAAKVEHDTFLSCSTPEPLYEDHTWEISHEALQINSSTMEECMDLETLNSSLELLDIPDSTEQHDVKPVEFKVPAKPRRQRTPRTPRSAHHAHRPPTSHQALQKITSKNRKRVRGPKNWEFLIRLLADKRYNPSVIRWEDEDDATFRLVQPDEIARMWSERSPDSPALSYNNFARGLRYHYYKGALEPVGERQLVYRCGPKALAFFNQVLC